MCLTCCCVSLTGSVVAQRSDHGTSAPPMLQAAASAAGAPLVASPYPQSYLQYNPPQYGQQQVIQAMAPYAGQVKKKRKKSLFSLLFEGLSEFQYLQKIIDASPISSTLFTGPAYVLHAPGWSQDARPGWWSPPTGPWSPRRTPVPLTRRCSSGATAGHLR